MIRAALYSKRLLFCNFFAALGNIWQNKSHTKGKRRQNSETLFANKFPKHPILVADFILQKTTKHFQKLVLKYILNMSVVLDICGRWNGDSGTFKMGPYHLYNISTNVTDRISCDWKRACFCQFLHNTTWASGIWSAQFKKFRDSNNTTRDFASRMYNVIRSEDDYTLLYNRPWLRDNIFTDSLVDCFTLFSKRKTQVNPNLHL